MTTNELKDRARQFLDEVWNAQNPDAVDDFMAPGFRQDRPLPGVENNRDGLKDWVRMTIQAFPDIHFSVDDQIGEGDTVVTRWTARGTHRDTFLGIPATNKSVTVEGITVAHYADGKATDNCVHWDDLGMLQQLGVVPAMGEGAMA